MKNLETPGKPGELAGMVNIRWTTISTHTRTKQNGRLPLRDKEARQLSTCLNR